MCALSFFTFLVSLMMYGFFLYQMYLIYFNTTTGETFKWRVCILTFRTILFLFLSSLYSSHFTPSDLPDPLHLLLSLTTPST